MLAFGVETLVQMTGWNSYRDLFAVAIDPLPCALFGLKFRDFIGLAFEAPNAFRPTHVFEVGEALLFGRELRGTRCAMPRDAML